MTGRPVLLSPEARILLLTAAVPPDEQALRRCLGPDVDWSTLAELAQGENATAIVLREISRIAPAGTVGEAARPLRDRAAVSLLRLLQLERLLHDVLDALASHGIEAMLLKGSALAYTAYASFADRPMGDLDLLVRPEHAERAWSLLESRGWSWPAERWPRALYTVHQHLPPLLLEDEGGPRVEIHKELLPGGHPFRWSREAVWARARQVSVDGRPLVVPHPLHLLLHVCVHFAWSHQMQWGAWRTLRDVSTIAARGHLDWQEFVNLARESKANTCCYWTLRLARSQANAAVPDRVLEALRPPRPEFVLKRLERHYVSNWFPSGTRCPSVRLMQHLWDAGIASRWSGHGTARPWQVSERWLKASAESLGDRSRPRPIGERVRRLGASIEYLRMLTATELRPTRVLGETT